MASEKRLIDAKALLLDNEQYFCKPCKEKGHDYHGVACRACWVDDMRIEIEDAPTVDAVEVVRCKDCKHYVYGAYDNGDMMCDQWGEWIFPNDDDFCSCGERKDNV